MSQNSSHVMGHQEPLSSSDIHNFTQDHDSDGFAESYGIPLDPELMRSLRREQQAIHGFEAALLYFFRDPPSILQCLGNRRRGITRRPASLLSKHTPQNLYDLNDQIQCIERGESVEYESEWFAHSTALHEPVSPNATQPLPAIFEVNYVYESRCLSTVTKVSLPLLDGHDLGIPEDVDMSRPPASTIPIYTTNNLSSSSLSSAERDLSHAQLLASSSSSLADAAADARSGQSGAKTVPPATHAATLTHCRYAELHLALTRVRETLDWHHTLFWCGLIFIVLITLFIRLAVGAHPHSGMATPPMYGDYEAQRHWMEVTLNLPVSDWYRMTADNDLNYWGLDYPPLSAYWALFWGKLAALWEPAMVALHSSRGYETISSKAFMRWSVIIADIIFYIPAAFMASYTFYRRYRMASRIMVFLFLLKIPLLTIIDHGHFQYNGVSIGLSLYAATAVLKRRLYLASILFCCSFLFKQNALYYALAFFGIILGLALRTHEAKADNEGSEDAEGSLVATSGARTSGSRDNGADAVQAGEGRGPVSKKTVVILKNDDNEPVKTMHSHEHLRKRATTHSNKLPRSSVSDAHSINSRSHSSTAPQGPRLTLAALTRVIKVGLVVLATVGVIFMPFVIWGHHPVQAVLQVLQRMFPISRGIFEDKVANFWCASNVLIKWKTLLSQSQLAMLSLALTLAFALPACIDVILRPTSKRFVYSLGSISLAFFLFSFQVHEKNILFPLIPLNLLCLYHPRLVIINSMMALYTCFPLIKRDGLTILYVISILTTILFAQTSTFQLSFVSQPFSFLPFTSKSKHLTKHPYQQRQDVPPPIIFYEIVLITMVHSLTFILPYFPQYPYLIETLISVHGFLHFATTWCFITYYQIFVLPSRGKLSEERE